MAKTKNHLGRDIISAAKSSKDSYLHHPRELSQRVFSELAGGIYRKEAVASLGERLIAVADYALDLHQTDIVDHASKLLINAPMPREYRGIGAYFQAMCLKRRAQKSKAQTILERVAESASTPLKFRARALLGIAALCSDHNRIGEASRFFLQAAQAASPRDNGDLQTYTLAQLMLAGIKGIQGDNKSALSDMEKIFPLVRFLMTRNPLVYYIYANNLAVELTELGRFEQARRASDIAVASPYAGLHPEWHETSLELTLKAQSSSRSTVAFKRATSSSDNIVRLPMLERSLAPASGDKNQPAQVFSLQEWKGKIFKEPSLYSGQRLSPKELHRMTRAQKRVRIMKLIYNENVSDEELTEILQFAEDLSLKAKG